MGKLNTNTFKSLIDYIQITKNSNTINAWLLSINFAVLFFLVNNLIKPYGLIEILLKENIYFKILFFLLFIWLTINVSILIIFTYKERILSLVIEDNYYRLKSFMSFMSNINNVTEEELMNMDMYKIHDLTDDYNTKKAIDGYVNKIMKYLAEIVKWSNKRHYIYKFVILASIPLLASAVLIVFYHL